MTREDMVWARVYATEFARLVTAFDATFGYQLAEERAAKDACSFADRAVRTMRHHLRSRGGGRWHG